MEMAAGQCVAATRLHGELDTRHVGHYAGRLMWRPSDPAGQACCFCHAELLPDEMVAVGQRRERRFRGAHCCHNGQVMLQPVRNQDGHLRELVSDALQSPAVAGTLAWALRNFPRVVNSALSLASQVVRRRPMPRRGMQAYVINMRVAHVMGPLLPNDNNPRFAQLYVFDPQVNGGDADDVPEDGVHVQRRPRSAREEQLDAWFRHARHNGGRAPSVRARRLLHQLVRELETELRRVNPYVQDFTTAAEMIRGLPPDSQLGVQLVLDRDARPALGDGPEGHHSRSYDARNAYGGRALNPAMFREVALLADPSGISNTDFCIRARCTASGSGGHLQQLSILHRSFDPLYFVLLFPYGDDGWRDEMYRVPEQTEATAANLLRGDLRTATGRRQRVTALQFYSHRLHWRRGAVYDGGRCVLMGGRLLQEYACTALARSEMNQLNWHRFNQSRYRTSTYQTVRDEVQQAAAEQRPVEQCGQPTILPRSFVGGVRDMRNRYMDAMAVVRELSKPSLFVTMTCNPKWPEIVESIPPWSRAEDHPEIVARVFNVKLQELMNDLTENHTLGRTVAHMMVVEFQYRGLPHAHILLILDAVDRLHNADHVDQIISAEIPAVDASAAPNVQARQRHLRTLVLEHMLHNDCTNDTNCRCRANGGPCRWKFPKPHASTTTWSDERIYPEPRRRCGPEYEETMANGRRVNNRWIAPYSPILLLKYQCHINVEACSSVEAVKYICEQNETRTGIKRRWQNADDPLIRPC